MLIEALNIYDVGPYLLSCTEEAVAFVDSIHHSNVRLIYDAYHMQRTEGDLVSTIERHWDRIGHIQIADNPGRYHPGSGEINYRYFLQVLQDHEYQGYVGLEYRPIDGDQDPTFDWIEEMGHSRRAAGVSV